MKKLSTLILMSVTIVLAWSCKKELEEVETFPVPTDVVNPNPPLPPVDFTKATLGDLAEQAGIKLGFAFTHSEYFQNDQVAEILKTDAKAVTFGNEMKHDAIVQANGRLKFDTADEMVGWAKEAGTELFGHVLGWHSQQQTSYLNALIDKAAADNGESILQDNWNFEKGSLDGYTVSGAELTKAYTEVFAGEYGLKTTADATVTFTAPTENGKPYIVSFWAKSLADGATVALGGASSEASAEWTRYSVTLKASSDGTDYTLTASAGVCLDNIRVIETEPEEEGDNSGAVYINPHAIAALDFEDYALGATGSALVSDYGWIETEPEPEGDTGATVFINPHAIDGGLDFESYPLGTTGTQLKESYSWPQINGAEYVTVTNEFSNSGSQSLKMDNADGHAGNAWDIQAITPAFPVTKGTTYRIAWYARANVEADMKIDIREDGSAKTYKNSAWGNYDKMGADTWTLQSLDYTVEEGMELSVAFYGATEVATYYIDDFQIFEAIYEGDYTNYIDPTNILVGGDFETADAWGVWNGSSYVELLSRNEPEIGSNAAFVHSGVHAYKVDNTETQYYSAEFYKLGLGDPNNISSISGSGTGDLLDEILNKLPKKVEEKEEDDVPRITVVGRPNAGKSSIINAFIGENRFIVTDIAGTTRDSTNTRYNKFGFDFYLVDTAGIRKKGKVTEDLEYFSVIRSIRSIENSDVCILMIDATRGIEAQDMNIFQLIQKNRKGIVVCVNKWDLITAKDSKSTLTFEKAIRERFAPFSDFPIIFTSAITKQRIFKVLEAAKEVYENRKRKIPTSKLNEFFLPLIENYPPPSTKGKYIKIKYVSQIPDTQIPSFVFYANLPQYVKEPYKRFLENKLREEWEFSGTPINIFIRQK